MVKISASDLFFFRLCVMYFFFNFYIYINNYLFYYENDCVMIICK